MKRVFAAVALAGILLAACGAPAFNCTDPLGCLEIPSGSPVVIGILYTSEGPEASAGMDELAQVERIIVEKGLLLDHEIDLIREGTDCTPEGARIAALRLARTSNLLAAIGPTCAADAAIAGPILGDAGIATITPYPPDTASTVNKLFSAIEQVAIRGRGGTLYIPRTALREGWNK